MPQLNTSSVDRASLSIICGVTTACAPQAAKAAAIRRLRGLACMVVSPGGVGEPEPAQHACHCGRVAFAAPAAGFPLARLSSLVTAVLRVEQRASSESP